MSPHRRASPTPTLCGALGRGKLRPGGCLPATGQRAGWEHVEGPGEGPEPWQWGPSTVLSLSLSPFMTCGWLGLGALQLGQHSCSWGPCLWSWGWGLGQGPLRGQEGAGWVWVSGRSLRPCGDNGALLLEKGRVCFRLTFASCCATPPPRGLHLSLGAMAHRCPRRLGELQGAWSPWGAVQEGGRGHLPCQSAASQSQAGVGFLCRPSWELGGEARPKFRARWGRRSGCAGGC